MACFATFSERTRADSSRCISPSRCAWSDSASDSVCNADASIIAFTLAIFLTRFAREAKRRVERVSVTSPSAGDAHTISDVLQLPPIDCCRMRVSTELRNGTCDAPPCLEVRAAMTLPNARREVLIF